MTPTPTPGTVIVTGAAGFVGFHVAQALLARGHRVVGLDNLNPYYDPALKQARLAHLTPNPAFTFHHLDLANKDETLEAFATAGTASHPVTHIVHLAAQAGVRFSMIDPWAYVSSNVMGHVTVLEAARRIPALQHLVYASSSSVYGGNAKLPFAESDPVDHPVSLYAATKRADELIAHAYWHLYGLPLTGLRFFTVYGPWGRPDMAYYAFAEAILAGRPITLYDDGRPRRDFTYIDDIVAGVLACLDHPPPCDTPPPVFNIGNNQGEPVSTLVALLESALGRSAIIDHVPRPASDVAETWADLTAIEARTGYRPTTPLADGIPKFVAWLLAYKARND